MTRILVDAEYDEQGIALVFYDTERHARIVIRPKSNHHPYFLVGDDRAISDSGIISVRKVEKLYLLQERWRTLYKIETKTPLDVEKLREKFEQTYEDKIPYVNCFIYDNGLIPGTPYRTNIIRNGTFSREEYGLFWQSTLLYPIPNVRRIALDIEVEETEQGYANPETAEGRIVCCAMYSEDRAFIYLLRTEQDDYTHKLQLQKVLERFWTPFGNVVVRCFDREEELILKTVETFGEYPFLITYNGSLFDLKYLYNRGLKLGISKDKLPIKLDKRDRARTTNTTHLDIYYMFYHHEPVFSKIGRYEDTTLNSVAMALLKEGQVILEKPMRESSYVERVSRCFQDAKLTYELTRFNDNMLIKLIFILARISRLTLPDACTAPYSLLVKGLFDAEHRRHNLLIPSGRDINARNEKLAKYIPRGSSGRYAGAEVLDPVPGIHFNVTVLDFPSMYPSIISERNLSYETVCCDHEECRRNKVENTELWICTKREGFLSVILGSLRDFRLKLKEKEKKAAGEEKNFLLVVHTAIKLILNAAYGVWGSESQELYFLPLAAATTSIGRSLIRQTVNLAEKCGMKVIFGDTDSILVCNPTNEQIETLNSELSTKTGMALDIGKVYRYVVMSSRKKNYLGIENDGNIDIKGLTGKKRHVCRFIRQVFQDVCNILKDVYTEKDFENAKVEIKNLINDAVNNLYTGEYEMEDMAFVYTLNKDLDEASRNSQIYRAASLLGNVRRGETIAIVLTKGRYSALPLGIATKEQVDIQSYVERLRTALEQVLEPMGMDFDEIIGKKPKPLTAFGA